MPRRRPEALSFGGPPPCDAAFLLDPEFSASPDTEHRSNSGVSHPNPQADHLCIGRGVVNARAGLFLRSPKTSPHSGQ